MTDETQPQAAPAVAPAAIDPGAAPEQVDAKPETKPGEAATVTQAEYNKLYFKFKQLERTSAEPAAAPAVAPEVKTAAATLDEDFDFDEEAFDAANFTKQVDTAVNKALAGQADKAAKEAEKASAATLSSGFNTKAHTFAQKNPDYIKAIEASNNVQYSPSIQSILLHADNGPEIDFYLLTHPQELQQIEAMHPTQAAMALAKATAAPAVQGTKAPPPFDSGGGGVAQSADYRTDENLPMKDFYANYMAAKKG